MGELAARTGLTVRTLHHYDQIGLLSPSRRTAAGHRLYGDEEVMRLQRIASLKHIGLSLDEIRDCLDDPDYSLERTLELHIARIDDEIERRRRLRELIRELRDRLVADEPVSVDELTRAIEVTMNYEKYYTSQQLSELAERRDTVGEDRIRTVEDEWRKLFAAFAKAKEDGIEPDSPEVKMLARRSAVLIDEFTGGDPGIEASLSEMYRVEGGETVLAQHDVPMSPDLWKYMGEARAALEAEVSRPESRSARPALD